MGMLFSSMFDSLFGTKEVRVLILGLDNAGKTTILCEHPLLPSKQGLWNPSRGVLSDPSAVHWCTSMHRKAAPLLRGLVVTAFGCLRLQ